MNLITSKYKLKILIGHMLNIFKRALDIDQKTVYSSKTSQ